MHHLRQGTSPVFAEVGPLGAAFNFLFAVCFIGLGIGFLIFTIHIVKNFLVPPVQPNANQPQINAIKQGFGLGLVFGFFSGYLVYKGIFFFYKSIDFFRGDLTSHLLIKYHDGILASMQTQSDDQIETANDQPTN